MIHIFSVLRVTLIFWRRRLQLKVDLITVVHFQSIVNRDMKVASALRLFVDQITLNEFT